MVSDNGSESGHTCHDEADVHFDDAMSSFSQKVVKSAGSHYVLVHSQAYPEAYDIPRHVILVEAMSPKP